jgi:error-prone DNA polymerase
LQPGRGDNANHDGGPDIREVKAAMIRPRDIYEPDRHIDTLKVKARHFR